MFEKGFTDEKSVSRSVFDTNQNILQQNQLLSDAGTGGEIFIEVGEGSNVRSPSHHKPPMADIDEKIENNLIQSPNPYEHNTQS